MNKEEAILKINKLGNISNIIVKICKIFTIIGFVFLIIGTIVMLALPKQLIKMNLGATADIIVDVSAFGLTFTEEDRLSLMEELNGDLKEETSVSMGLNGAEYVAGDVTVDESTICINTAVDVYTIEFGDLVLVFGLGIISVVALFVTLTFAGKLCRAFRDCQSPFEENVVKNLHTFAYSLLPWVIMSSLAESISNSVFTNNFEIMVGVDMGILLLIFFIFLLAYIFKYGAVLQKESDETL